MQIHELTKLTEAGIIDYVKAAMSKDPNLAGMSVTQRAQAIQNNTVIKQLGEVLTQQWMSKVAILQKQAVAQPQQFQAQAAAGQPKGRAQIDPAVYKKYLVDFVNKTVFRNQMRYLDASSRAQVDNDIDSIVASKDNPQSLLPLFQNLAQTASLTMMTTPGSQNVTAPGTAQTNKSSAQPPAAATKSAATAPSAASVKRDFESVGVRFPGREALQQTIEQLHGDSRVSKTDNAYANAILQLMGFTVQ